MEVASFQSAVPVIFDAPDMSLIDSNEMDIDMEIDLGPIDDNEFTQSVRHPLYPAIIEMLMFS